MTRWIEGLDQETARYRAAERFVGWLERRVMIEARGDEESFSHVDPTGRFWLGRLGPKDFVTRPDERQDRVEPCAIGLRIRPAAGFPASFEVRVSSRLWKRRRADDDGGLRWAWDKTEPVVVSLPVLVEDRQGDQVFGADAITDAMSAAGDSG